MTKVLNIQPEKTRLGGLLFSYFIAIILNVATGLSSQITPCVWVCNNHWCRSRGAEAALASFVGLMDSHKAVTIQEVECFGACEKGPNIRVKTQDDRLYEINKVDDIDRVVSILEDLLSLDVSSQGVEAMQYNLEANRRLQLNDVDGAILYYDRALAVGWASQEGVIRTLRSEAHLVRAGQHRSELERLLNFPGAAVESSLERESCRVLIWATLLTLSVSETRLSGWLYILSSLCSELEQNNRLRFYHAALSVSLARSLDDALRAASLLPNLYINAARAAEIFVLMGKWREAAAAFAAASEIASDEMSEEFRVMSQEAEVAAAAAAAAAAAGDTPPPPPPPPPW